MGFIYKITAPDGKIYVGQTIRTLKVRWQFHCYAAEYGSNQPICQNIRKHGKENFTIELLDEVPDDELDSREIDFIDTLDSLHPNGLNVNGGGSNVTIDSRQANSDSRRKYIPDDFKLPLNFRCVMSEDGLVKGFRLDVPGKKAYSYIDSAKSLQEKYELAIAKYEQVIAGTDDPTEDRKKKTEFGATLPQYIYCGDKAGRLTVRVIVPGHRSKYFSSTKKTRDELIADAVAYKQQLLAGEIREDPLESKPKNRNKTTPLHIQQKKDGTLLFLHPRPTPGMKRFYFFRDLSIPIEERIAQAVALRDGILSGEIPETSAR